jgi:hypothetical protein
MKLRNPLNLQALIGAGINLPFKRGFFKLEVGYRIGLKNFVNTKNRYTAEPDNVFQYYYTDNDFLFNQFNFNVGYYYKFYKPEKLNAK